MSIDKLPDDCLLIILDYIRELQDLINCYRVCVKWKNIFVSRTAKIKYWIDQPSNSPDYFPYQIEEPYDLTWLWELFPNLRIAYFSNGFCKKARIEDVLRLVRNSKSLKGIIFDICDNRWMPIWACFEMVSNSFIGPMSEVNNTVKQLYLRQYSLSYFQVVVHYFPNLERVKIQYSDVWPDWSGFPVLANLKIAEMSSSNLGTQGFDSSFRFMDLCPALQSAHIRIGSQYFFFKDSHKNSSLQDLVIEICEDLMEWDAVLRLMSKYPNLKHLALRNFKFSDGNIMELILILPKLTLLDVRESCGVDQKDADDVQDYCKEHGKTIKFYFKKGDKRIELDWPQLSTQHEPICHGFDFMKHCFLKDFSDLPYFLDPIDD